MLQRFHFGSQKLHETISHIIRLTEASGKVIWPIGIALLAALVSEQTWPELFVGLPIWAIPTLRLFSILFGVLCIFSFFNHLYTAVRKIVFRATHSLFKERKRQKIRKRLLSASRFEVIVLSVALAKMNRSIRQNPDLHTIITLEESGIIEKSMTFYLFGDNLEDYKIPDLVWRELTTMNEFSLINPSGLLEQMSSNPEDQERLLLFLPQMHPAVQNWKAELSSSNSAQKAF